MRYRASILLLCLMALLYTVNSCKRDPKIVAPPSDGNFPAAVGKIFINKCVSCHGPNTAINSGNLRLDSWEELFKGGAHGSVAVPYNTKYSSLLYFINVDPALGPVSSPVMPVNADPLTTDEYLTIKNWIANGAPDKNGNIPFASDPDTRQKIYVTMQGCDLLGVIDATSGLIMRYIPVGMTNNTEAPHCVRVSADSRYAYVGFIAGQYLQKIDTRTDTVVASLDLGLGSWNIINLSPDGTQLMIANYDGNGAVKMVNTTSMTPGQVLGSGLFSYPHGIASDSAFNTFFITGQFGNTVYKLTLNPFSYTRLTINDQPQSTTSVPGVTPDPHEILMTPDHSKYFLSCQNTNEIRVMDTYADTLIKAIPVGNYPQEIAISPQHHLIYVTCMEDIGNTTPGNKGSVYVINYESLALVGHIYGDFFNPHGIAVDERDNRLYVVSANLDSSTVPPHHVSVCGGKNGWYSVYNLNSLQPVNSIRYEVTNYPYGSDTRFK